MKREEYIEMTDKVNKYNILKNNLDRMEDAKQCLITEKVTYTETRDLCIKFRSEAAIEKFNQAVKECLNIEIEECKKEMEEI